MATHFEQSNYLPNQKQGTINRYDLTLFIRLFLGSSNFQGFRVFQAQKSSSGITDETHPRFPLKDHILNIGGDALTPI
jgi:hypothetical protein